MKTYSRIQSLLPLVAAIALLLLPRHAPAQQREPSVELPQELQRVLTDYEQAWAARDADALAALFTEDGFVLPRNAPPVRGREAIREHYEGSGGPLALRALAYSLDGDTAFIIGAYGRERDGPDIGKFTLTLRRVDGRWLIASDMDSGNAAPNPRVQQAQEPGGGRRSHALG